ncbi:class I SAM-dependent methyltransferase [Limnoglobus roseus]|uniref:Methyltransferase domain-containing protein n=1 Tax=Limnoglobus roseus TaxID=2598579 RepID=A0A5C1A5G2_9BACT|nr:class I SAM-dependent methyltransferase [Limnoglobus roseus]QEL13565.1 methyltransferase domain-containing protein [Limnoglobus roseus]
MRPFGISIFCLLAVLLPLAADDPKAKPRYETRADHDPDGIGKFYLNREIAHVMGHQAAGWLDRPEREKEEDPAKLLKALDIKPGMVIADIGAGSGFHTLRMAPLVGEKGKVLAVDIQKEMIDLVEKRAKEKKLANVETVLSTETDPKLPAGTVDLIILVDVYHEFSHPYEMTEKMIAALKPGGRIAFVEFRLEDPKVPIKLVHKMTERQVTLEMEQFPEMSHQKTDKSLPWQHIILFEKKAKK